MGSTDKISVTCDCGRQINVAASMAGSQTNCPVCGNVVLIPLQQRGPSGPPCPHCGRPWPATEDRCPACLARTRTKKKEETLNQSTFSSHFDDIDSEIDSGNLSALDEEDFVAAAPAPARMQLPGLANFWKNSSAQGWYLATTLVLLGAISMLFKASLAGSGLIWLSGAIIFLLLTVGMLRGSNTAKNATTTLTLLGGLILIAVAIALSPKSVKLAPAIMTAVSIAASLVGFSILTNQPKNSTAVMTGGGIMLFAMIAVMIFSAASGMKLSGENISNLLAAKDNPKTAESTSPDVSDKDAAEDNSSATDKDINSSTQPDGQMTQNDEDTQQPSSSDIISAPITSDMFSRSEGFVDASGNKKEPEQSTEDQDKYYRDISAKAWLTLMEKENCRPKFPVGSSFSSKSVNLPLSPLIDPVTLKGTLCRYNDCELFIWVSPSRQQDELQNEQRLRELLEWTAAGVGKKYRLKIRNDLWSSNVRQRVMADLYSEHESMPYEGRIFVTVIDQHVVAYGGVYNTKNREERAATRVLLASLSKLYADSSEQ